MYSRDSHKEPKSDGLGWYWGSCYCWTWCYTSAPCFTCKIIKLYKPLEWQSFWAPNLLAICVVWELLRDRLCLESILYSPNRHLSISKFSDFKLSTEQTAHFPDLEESSCFQGAGSEILWEMFLHAILQNPPTDKYALLLLTARLCSKARNRRWTVCSLQKKEGSSTGDTLLGK